MDPIHTLIRRAWWRVFASRSISAVAVGLTLSFAAVIVWRLLSTVVWAPGSMSAWWAALGIAALIGCAGAVLWSAWRVQRGQALARLVDERAGLRESLSTAMCVAASNDPWSRATVEQAGRTAAGVDVRRAIPIETPRHWPAPVTAVLVAAGAIMLPAPNVAGWFGGGDNPAERPRDELAEVRAEVDQATAELEARAERLGLDVSFDDEASDQLGAPEQMTPEQIKSAAVKKLTSLTDELNTKMDSPEQKAREALQRSLRKLRQPGPGPAEDMARAMARGEFGKAQDALSKLQDELAEGELSDEQRGQLERQLENLSSQLDQIAQQQNAAERALQQAGLSEQQAKQLAQAAAENPDQLRQALDKLENMSDAQKQQLMQQAQAAAQSAQQSTQMAQAMAQMAQSMAQNADPSQMQAAADALGDQLSEMEMLAGDMAAMQSMMNQAQQAAFKIGQGFGTCPSGQCQGGTCSGSCEGHGQGQGQGEGQGTGRWSQGDTSRPGGGSGGAGQGFGGSPDARETSYRLTSARSAVNTTDGPIIGSRLVYEGQVRGESRAEFAVAAKSASSEAADAVESMRVPRAYEAAVMRYFGALERRADNDSGGDANNQNAGDE